MRVKRGDVVFLSFLYTDLPGSKRRPALVLSSDAYNLRRADIVVAPITSNLATEQPDDTSITNRFIAGLLKPSVLKGYWDSSANICDSSIGKALPRRPLESRTDFHPRA